MQTLYLSDNGYTIRRKHIRTVAGKVPAGPLLAHCYLSETEEGVDGAGADDPIGNLEVSNVPLVGDIIEATPFTGSALNTALEALLDAAENADEELRIYDIVHIAGMHRDVLEVVVERIRLTGET